jgi:PAS domain S-box-containing protein
LAKIYGYETPDELIQSIEHIDRQLYVDPHRREEFIKVMDKQDVVYQFESAIYRKDGNVIWISENARAVKDDQGNLLFYEGAVKDITDLKKVEEALRRQNSYLSTAAEVSRLISSTLDLPTLFERTVSLIQSRFKYYHVAVFTVDESGFNATLREATGEAGSEMKKNQHFLPVGSKSIIGNVTGNGETLIANNTAIDLIHRPNPLLPDTLAEVGIPLKIGTRVIGALDIQSTVIDSFHEEDINVLQTLADQIAVAIDNARSYELAQKAVTEIRELDRIKSQFLANMSHELRTPLNSIIGFSRVILKGIDGPVSDQQQQDLNAIYNSGQHLLGLINDILDLSKIEAGKMDLAVEEMSIGDTINSVLSTAAGLVKDKTVKLKQDVPPNLPTIRADPMRIRQVVLNLISNAAKFTDEGSITVSAETHISPTGHSEILVSITDTGPGISLEDQTKLFQAFSQVDSSPTRRTGGTGLGLSICQRLVGMHNGRIGVRSVVGKGSTFYFTIPQFHQPTVEATPGQGKIILCIDDDQQVIGLYDRYLKPQGYQVIPITHSEAARDAIKRLKPYAVTLDIMMPEIDGWSLLEELKADPETRNTPIIICSIVEEEEKGFSLGASDYLVKPVLEEDLLGALNRLNGDGMIKNVLIIDDSPVDLRLMEKMISEHSKFRPILAEGGEKGWEIIVNDHPDLIILDLFMPDLNGFTILEQLRTTPELRDIPVVVVSGVDLEPDQKKQLDNLGKHLLQKAMLNEQELFATLTKALKRLEVR